MLIPKCRGDESEAAPAEEGERCERCQRLEAENYRLREMVRMVAAIGDREDLVQAVLGRTHAGRG